MTITVENREIPVLLLTGYLGSGKTTLVNRILANKKGIKFAVIVNDIGEVNIDADLIQQGGVVNKKDDSLVALQNGCICCTLKMDLVEQIREIIEMGRFDYIVIEASGICEPAPIAQTICSFPKLVPEYAQSNIPKLDCIVTVVDALRMQSEFACGDALKKDNLEEDDLENLVIQQIEFCNIVLLNKASEVKPEELGRVRSIVKALNPKVTIFECDYGDIDLDKLLNTRMFDFDKTATSAAWINAIEGEGNEADHDDDDHDEDHDGHEHDHHHEEHDHEHHHEGHEHHHHHDHDEHDEHDHEHEHHHDHDEDEHNHEHGHHHDHDHDEHDEHEHHHHHHDGEECDDPECECHHHHHHHADDVFSSWGKETPKKFSKEALEDMLHKLDSGDYGHILRAKGIVNGEDGWLEFDYVPEEHEVRAGHPDYTGRLCVIGAELKEDGLAELFGV